MTVMGTMTEKFSGVRIHCNNCFGNYVNDFFGGKLHRPQKLEEQQEDVVGEKF